MTYRFRDFEFSQNLMTICKLKVVWFFEDEPITTTTESEIQIETTENYTALRIPKAKRYTYRQMDDNGLKFS